MVAHVGPGILTATIGGLTNGMEYRFSVSAVNSVGEGPASQYMACVVGAVPSAPLGLSASVGNGSITISWKEPASNGGSDVLSYHVWRSSNGMSSIIADLGDSTTFNDGSVVPGTFYNYSLTASNLIGTSVPAGPLGAFAVVTPSAPSGLVVSQVAASILVSWNVPASDGGIPLTGYISIVPAAAGGRCCVPSMTHPHFHVLTNR